jgi:hypothetical protein
MHIFYLTSSLLLNIKSLPTFFSIINKFDEESYTYVFSHIPDCSHKINSQLKKLRGHKVFVF